jgi:hypothetical protein
LLNYGIFGIKQEIRGIVRFLAVFYWRRMHMDEYQEKDKVVRQYIIDTVRDEQNIDHQILVEKILETIKEKWRKILKSDSCFSHESIHDGIVRNILILVYKNEIELGVEFEVEEGRELDEGRYGKPYYTLPLRSQSESKS